MKISLVSFGIELYPATQSQSEIRFHQIDRKTGQRVRHLNVIDGDTPIESSEIIKGYEYSKGEYISVEPNEIAALRIPTRRVIEIAHFVDLNEIPRSLFESPFFVVPQPKESSDAFTIMRKAMEQSGKAGIGEMAFAGREHLVAIAVPPDKSFEGFMAYTLRYGEELRDGREYYSEAAANQVDKRQLAMASELIKAYSAPLTLSDYKDDYEFALRNLIEAKQKHMPLPLDTKAPRQAKTPDLMDALRRSLNQARRLAPGKTQVKMSTRKKGPTLVRPSARKHKAA